MKALAGAGRVMTAILAVAGLAACAKEQQNMHSTTRSFRLGTTELALNGLSLNEFVQRFLTWAKPMGFETCSEDPARLFHSSIPQSRVEIILKKELGWRSFLVIGILKGYNDPAAFEVIASYDASGQSEEDFKRIREDAEQLVSRIATTFQEIKGLKKE